ncbi:MAG: A/G-specific adenine glycosylase [Verrucomicrobiota bacterium]
MSDALPSSTWAQVIRGKLHSWFTQQGRDLPWRRNTSPYAVLVSEFMLQQTQVATVIPYFERWLEAFPDIATLAAATEDEVLKLWQGLGYYSRARNLHAAAKAIVANFSGLVPSDPKLLGTLPGVGPYTAGAIASFAFDLPAPAVDANIARVLARLTNQLTPIDTPSGAAALWECASLLLPENAGGRLHTSALMELGALICSPKRPKCLVCPIQTFCLAKEPELIPVKSARKATIHMEEKAAWIVHKNCILLEQQKGRRAGGLWKLPASPSLPENKPIFETVYPFTNHKITLRVFESEAPASTTDTQRWFPVAQVLDEAALTAPHRRALKAILSQNQ